MALAFKIRSLPTLSAPSGLLGMRERAQFCGGDIQISTSPGNGATITVRVPVDLPRAQRSQPCAS